MERPVIFEFEHCVGKPTRENLLKIDPDTQLNDPTACGANDFSGIQVGMINRSNRGVRIIPVGVVKSIEGFH